MGIKIVLPFVMFSCFCISCGVLDKQSAENKTCAGELKLRSSQDARDNMFGINIFSDKDIPWAQKLGVHFVRFDILWDCVERKKGSFDYSRYDKYIQEMKAAKLKGLVILGYGNKLYGGNFFMKSSEGLAAWKKFIKETVSRYKNDISWWEIWNEPNSDHFFPAQKADYADILKISSEIIREIQPEAVICMGGTANTDMCFIKSMLELGCGPYTDVVAYHPYRPNPENAELFVDAQSYEDTVSKLRALVHSYDKRLKIWNTEQGIQSALPCSGFKAGIGSSELMQAKYLLRRLLLEESLKIERTVIFYATEIRMPDPAQGDLPNTKGLIAPGGKPKHAYYALQNISAVFDSSVKPFELHANIHDIKIPVQPAGADKAIELEAETPKEIVPPLAIMNDQTASGGKYIATPDSSEPAEIRKTTGKYTKGNNDEKGYAIYELTIKEEGDYYIFGRVKAPRMTGTSDSFYVTIDDSPEFVWDTGETGNKWEWVLMITTRNGFQLNGSLSFKTGTHSIKIRTREDGTALDKLLITRSIAKLANTTMQTAPIIQKSFVTRTGIPMLSFWKATGIIDWQNVQDATATITIHSDKIKDPVLVDLLSKDHKVYKLNDFDLKNGMIIIRNVPLTDYPMLITDRSAIDCITTSIDNESGKVGNE